MASKKNSSVKKKTKRGDKTKIPKQLTEKQISFLADNIRTSFIFNPPDKKSVVSSILVWTPVLFEKDGNIREFRKSSEFSKLVSEIYGKLEGMGFALAPPEIRQIIENEMEITKPFYQNLFLYAQFSDLNMDFITKANQNKNITLRKAVKKMGSIPVYYYEPYYENSTPGFLKNILFTNMYQPFLKGKFKYLFYRLTDDKTGFPINRGILGLTLFMSELMMLGDPTDYDTYPKILKRCLNGKVVVKDLGYLDKLLKKVANAYRNKTSKASFVYLKPEEIKSRYLRLYVESAGIKLKDEEAEMFCGFNGIEFTELLKDMTSRLFLQFIEATEFNVPGNKLNSILDKNHYLEDHGETIRENFKRFFDELPDMSRHFLKEFGREHEEPSSEENEELPSEPLNSSKLTKTPPETSDPTNTTSGGSPDGSEEGVSEVSKTFEL